MEWKAIWKGLATSVTGLTITMTINHLQVLGWSSKQDKVAAKVGGLPKKAERMVHLKLMGNSKLGMIPNFSENFHHFQVNQVAFCLAYGGGLESCCSLDLHISKQSKSSHISQQNGTFQPIRAFFLQSKKNETIWSTFANNPTHFYKQYLRIWQHMCVCESPIFHFSVVFFSTIQLHHWDSQTHSYCIFALWEVVLVAWVPGSLLHQLSTSVCFLIKSL